MTFLLDTNVISELRKVGDGRADARVVAWIEAVDAGACYLSVITVMELELGIARVQRRDQTQAARLRRWVDELVLPEFAGRILSIDMAVAVRCAHLHVPDPRPERDGYIAATALVHGMTVITRNTADYVPTGVTLLNPWTH
ncbi:type II toxin-antitoxin system VapC family toxin [Acidisoma cellulosilytica]|uniref:Ribonuclease VapC n=1 Tax=Acidisoma cellulosilyticum TaxID=2802395 RepID=A0A963Z5P8_9PROT|nr:type II toxin-antitoxin system VapC family toxin [Acidisoma cellulosilyticum]MCB8882327.1 type II toxin-antitoxin system VapC family toxin [Acidisoma cellulosilyticum]